VPKPGLDYNGYWCWGGLTIEDVRRDLRQVTREIRPG
jgi:hypothetical protein